MTDSTMRLLLRAVEDTLRFDYVCGDRTGIARPHSTGWRTLPCLLAARVEGAVRVEWADGSAAVSNQNAAVCVPPGKRHRITLITERGVSIWAHVNCTVFDGLDLFSVLTLPAVLGPGLSRRVGTLNTALAKLPREGALTWRHVIRRKALGLSLVSELAAVGTVAPHRLRLLESARRVAPALTYIRRHMAHPLAVRELGALVHLSPSRFHAIFREATGASPRAYLRNVRLREAQALLVTSDLTVTEIARKVGQEDPFHFSRIFKRHLGVSPRQFRSEARSRLLAY